MTNNEKNTVDATATEQAGSPEGSSAATEGYAAPSGVEGPTPEEAYAARRAIGAFGGGELVYVSGWMVKQVVNPGSAGEIAAYHKPLELGDLLRRGLP